MTAPAPATRRRWSTRSSPASAARRSSTSASAPACRQTHSGRPAAACSASSQIPGWHSSPACAASRSRSPRSRTGTRHDEPSTRSSQGRRGTGRSARGGGEGRRGVATRWSDCAVLERGPAAGRAGSSFLGRLPTSPARHAVRHAGDRSAEQLHPDPHEYGDRAPRGRGVHRTGAAAVRLGPGLHTRAVARPGADLRRPQHIAAGQARGSAAGLAAAIDAAGGTFTMRYATVAITASRRRSPE